MLQISAGCQHQWSSQGLVPTAIINKSRGRQVTEGHCGSCVDLQLQRCERSPTFQLGSRTSADCLHIIGAGDKRACWEAVSEGRILQDLPRTDHFLLLHPSEQVLNQMFLIREIHFCVLPLVQKIVTKNVTNPNVKIIPVKRTLAQTTGVISCSVRHQWGFSLVI